MVTKEPITVELVANILKEISLLEKKGFRSFLDIKENRVDVPTLALIINWFRHKAGALDSSALAEAVYQKILDEFRSNKICSDMSQYVNVQARLVEREGTQSFVTIEGSLGSRAAATLVATYLRHKLQIKETFVFSKTLNEKVVKILKDDKIIVDQNGP